MKNLGVWWLGIWANVMLNEGIWWFSAIVQVGFALLLSLYFITNLGVQGIRDLG